jgi:hypothetical protein
LLLPALELLLQIFHVAADSLERVLDAIAQRSKRRLQRQLRLDGCCACCVRVEHDECCLLAVDLVPAVQQPAGSLQRLKRETQREDVNTSGMSGASAGAGQPETNAMNALLGRVC